MFQKWIKNKIIYHKFVKLIFFSIVTVLIVLITHQHTSLSINPTKTKVKSVIHIREPTNDSKLIIATKQHYVVDVPNPKYKQYHRQVNVIATAYVPLCKEGCTGITETGIDVKNNTTYHGMKIIATDPSVIPLHSIVKIKTEHTSFIAIAEDTGGGIKNFEVDVLMSTTQQAINFGREYATITILREGES